MHFVKGREESRGRQGLLSPSQWGLDIKMSCWSGPFPSQWALRIGCGHHSEVPTWASCHKLRKIMGEGLGWHQKSHPHFFQWHFPPVSSRPIIVPLCGPPAEGKHLWEFLIMCFFPLSQTVEQQAGHPVLMSLTSMTCGGTRAKTGEVGSPSHITVSNTSEKSIPSPVLGRK